MDLGRSLRLWLELQAAVNALLDSSTAPEAGVQARTRQAGRRPIHSAARALLDALAAALQP